MCVCVCDDINGILCQNCIINTLNEIIICAQTIVEEDIYESLKCEHYSVSLYFFSAQRRFRYNFFYCHPEVVAVVVVVVVTTVRVKCFFFWCLTS